MASTDWKPVTPRLTTDFTANARPGATLLEHPRPQLERKRWANLNGLWNYAITPGQVDDAPKSFSGQIHVPFAIESALSGVGESVKPDQKLWYQRTFTAPSMGKGERLLLHFDAVDFHAVVWLNGKQLGEHKGGSDPFTFDVTDALKPGTQELTLSVTDPTDSKSQPRGKQVLNPNGIWYTPVTGIWQTVWLEVVPATSIQRVKLIPDIDKSELRLSTVLRVSQTKTDSNLTAEVFDNGKSIATVSGPASSELKVSLPGTKLWSPDSPHLYDLQLTLTDSAGTKDVAKSYFAMRKVSTIRTPDGHLRMALNNQPVFMYGPLDQGWWPDGLLTPPSDEAMKFDVEITKKLGFNMCRKHIKVEPSRWYYWCDKLGLMVWQDMPSGMDSTQGIKPEAKEDAVFEQADKDQFKVELKAMLDHLHNVPSIVVWVVFNEGWGQHDTNDLIAWTKQYDPTRLANGPSGWEDRGFGDMHDRHNYPAPDMFPITNKDRVAVLGEFGGLGWPVPGRLWQGDKNWGYRTYASADELKQQYQGLIDQLIPLIDQGLSAAVYTQTTDVEGEVNGLLTYDRQVTKFDAAWLGGLNESVWRRRFEKK